MRSDHISSDIENVIKEFLESLERRIDKNKQSTGQRSIILDVSDHMKRVAVATISLQVYKKDSANFDADHSRWVIRSSQGTASLLNPVRKLALALPFLRPIVSRLSFKSNRAIGTRLMRAIEERRVSGENDITREKPNSRTSANGVASNGSVRHASPKRRIIDIFLDKLKKNAITFEEFVCTSYFLILAASDSTSSTATCIFWHLAQNTDIQTKLRDSLISEGIDADYVLWCIMEAVRWHPPAPLGTGRIITEDITTKDGILIPKGSYVMPSTYSIHHDDSIWPAAGKFIPERWRYQSEFHPAAFLGFGLGPRYCVGKNMAIYQLKLIIQAVLTRYRIERCDETVTEFKFVSPGMIWTLPEKPVLLRFTPLN